MYSKATPANPVLTRKDIRVINSIIPNTTKIKITATGQSPCTYKVNAARYPSEKTTKAMKNSKKVPKL